MRVLYLTMNPNRASTTTPTEGWFRILRTKGLSPVLVSHQAGAFHEWAMAQGIPAYALPLPAPSKLAPWRFVRSVWQLCRLVSHYNIQLIHCNEQDIYPIGHYVSRLCKVPVLVSVHFTMNRGYCEWAFGGKRCPDRIIFISRGNQEACRSAVTGVIPSDRWRLLYNGLDLEYYVPEKTWRERFRVQHGLHSELLIGVACALRPRKQVEHLFEAASRIEHPHMRVVLAGGPMPGDEAYAEQLLEMARQKLGTRFLYLGQLRAQSDLRDLYNGLDVFVNTSQEEACSISVLEAMACGCPVVGYPSKSVDEQVLPDGGAIVNQDDISALTVELEGWLTDDIKLQAGKKGARRRTEEAFDILKLSDQLWNEYQDLLAKC